MEKISFNPDRYKPKKGMPTHALGEAVDRACKELNIPFNTFLLRARKINADVFDRALAATKEKKAGIEYFTTTFWSIIKSLKNKHE